MNRKARRDFFRKFKAIFQDAQKWQGSGYAGWVWGITDSGANSCTAFEAIEVYEEIGVVAP